MTQDQLDPQEPTERDYRDDAEVRAYLRKGPRPGDANWVDPEDREDV
jgi:hypothetical protein